MWRMRWVWGVVAGLLLLSVGSVPVRAGVRTEQVAQAVPGSAAQAEAEGQGVGVSNVVSGETAFASTTLLRGADASETLPSSGRMVSATGSSDPGSLALFGVVLVLGSGLCVWRAAYVERRRLEKVI